MSMLIKEDHVPEIESSDSLSEYLMSLRKAITDETNTIALYDSMLNNSKIPAIAKEVIREINDDEKDHLVLLTELLEEEVHKDFPEYGDNPNEEDEGMSISEEDNKE